MVFELTYATQIALMIYLIVTAFAIFWGFLDKVTFYLLVSLIGISIYVCYHQEDHKLLLFLFAILVAVLKFVLAKLVRNVD